MSLVRAQYIPQHTNLTFFTNVSLNTIQLYTNTTAGVLQNQKVGWLIKPKIGFTLQGGVVAANDIIEVADTNGTTVGTATTVAFTDIAVLEANKNYLISFTRVNATAATIGTLLGSIRSQLAPKVSDFFTNVIIVAPLPSGITTTTNPTTGAITVTFTNYPLVAGEDMNTVFFEVATTSGTFTVTSSNTAVFDSYNQAFVANNSIVYTAYAKQTTNFTGTVVLSVTGAGILAVVPFLWIPSNFDPLATETVLFNQNMVLSTPVPRQMAIMDASEPDLKRIRTF